MQRVAAKLGLGGAALSAAPAAGPGPAGADLGAGDALEAPLSQPELRAAQATAVTLLYGRDFARRAPVEPPAAALEAPAGGEDAAEGAMAAAERALTAPPGRAGAPADVDLRALDFDRVVSKVLVDPGVQRAVFRALREDFWRAAQRRSAVARGDSLLPAFEDLATHPCRDPPALQRAVERLLAALGGAADGICRALRAAPALLAWGARDARERAASALRPDPAAGPGEADAVLSSAVSCAALVFTVVFARRGLALLQRGIPVAPLQPSPGGAL